MDTEQFLTALEAQFLMRHCVPLATWDGQAITAYAWEEAQVRQALAVPLDALWEERLLALEMHGLATFSLHAPPLELDAEGHEREIPGWRDEPRARWGDLWVDAAGVLRLAALYGRPFVRVAQAPDVLLAHWKLVQREAECRLATPQGDEEWREEWPERWTLFQARVREAEGD